MKLIKNWPQAWKWWSVHGALAVAAISAVYAALPALQGIIPPTIYAWLMFGLGVAIILLRVLQQAGPTGTSVDDGIE